MIPPFLGAADASVRPREIASPIIVDPPDDDRPKNKLPERIAAAHLNVLRRTYDWTHR
jgi:hypothetical protein